MKFMRRHNKISDFLVQIGDPTTPSLMNFLTRSLNAD